MSATTGTAATGGASLASLTRGQRGAAEPRIRLPTYLSVERLGKTFGEFTALDDVSLEIGQGEFVSFLGPSGCGKTTLLRAIAGLDPATSGRIVQAGQEVTALPPSRRDFGIVFQSYALFPNLSVERNVGYGLRGPAWPRARAAQRVRELLDLVGLTEHARKYPAQMSGGQQQRVALARALAAEPGLLLLDEPLSALDAIVRLRLRSEIRAVQRRLGVTTVMVTHDQEEAMSVSDRIVVMSRGRVEQVGPPEEIYRRPASAFVAGFVGRSSAFDAAVDTDGGVAPRGDGPRFASEWASRMPARTPLRVFVRPEDVRLGADAEGLPGGFEARVESVEFLGAATRVALRAGTLSLEADLPAERLLAAGLFEGASTRAAVPAAKVLAFPADA